ncbi:MAG: alpha-N-arabinofuranosidase [Acidobacteriota bacterium]|nr:alpha-N-arabinofuranosidase [Acidobacteriota bacterium]
MQPKSSRRHFVGGAAAASLTALLPEGLFSQGSTAQSVVVRPGSEIGIVRPEFHSNFAEHLGSCVYGGIWVGKDSPIPNIGGYRKAAVDALKELGIPVLRWPGGCFADNYHWRDGIGPVEKRPRRVNMNWANAVEESSFGLHEFIGFCRLIGAEPYLSVNVGSGTPQEALDWIEYCNFPKGTTLADERIANGSPEPFRVRYWGVGNEAWGCGGRMTPQHYADVYRQFSNYMRTFGGTVPFLIACGPNQNDANWTRGFFGGMIGTRGPSGFAMHYYQNGSLPATQFTADAMDQQLSIFHSLEQAIEYQRTLIDSFTPPPAAGRGRGGPAGGRGPAPRVALVVDEWGVWDRSVPEEIEKYGQLWQQSTMRSAVAAGLGLNIFNRQADKLYMCNIAQMVNVLQSLLLTDGPQGQHCVRTTTYHAFAMYKAHRSKMSVKVDSGAKEPLDLSMSASKSGSELVISFVNPKAGAGIRVDCSLDGHAARSATAQIMTHKDFNAANTFGNPNAIVPQPHPVRASGTSVALDLPPMSVVTATVQLG